MKSDVSPGGKHRFGSLRPPRLLISLGHSPRLGGHNFRLGGHGPGMPPRSAGPAAVASRWLHCVQFDRPES